MENIASGWPTPVAAPCNTRPNTSKSILGAVALINEPMPHEDQDAPVAQATAVRDWLPMSARSKRHGGEAADDTYTQSAEAWEKTHAEMTAAFKAEHGADADPTDPGRYMKPPPYFQTELGSDLNKPCKPRDAKATERIFEGEVALGIDPDDDGPEFEEREAAKQNGGGGDAAASK